MFLHPTMNQHEAFCATLTNELRCELREHRGMELSGNSSRVQVTFNVHQVHQFALCWICALLHFCNMI